METLTGTVKHYFYEFEIAAAQHCTAPYSTAQHLKLL
jgi:hypothetical protein